VKSLLDTFLKDVGVAAEAFTQSAPYSHENITTLKAFAILEESKNVSLVLNFELVFWEGG